MLEENINHEFRWNKINEIRNYLIKEINQNELMSKNRQKVCTVLNYIHHSLVSNSTITWMCFHYFSWYFNRNCKFYNSIKNLCNNRRN